LDEKNNRHSKDGLNKKNKKNNDNLGYDEEIGRKTVGKLISGLDDEIAETDKPAVRAIRLNSQKVQREKISTSFYDEDRAKSDNDAIVTGFKEVEDEAEEEIVDEIEDSSPTEEDLADTVRIRRPNILKDDPYEDQGSRERYRKQFLEGYTDHERKRLDLGLDAEIEQKKRPAASPEEVPTRNNTEEERALPPKKRPKEGTRRPREEPRDGSQRPRRPKESNDEVALIPKRGERREKASAQAAAVSQPSYGAPIFKIIAIIFLIMIAVIVVLIININSVARQVDELEATIEQFDEDVGELATLRAENMALRARVDDLTDENNQRLSQIDDLERQLLVQNTDAGSVPGAASNGGAGTPPASTEGMRRHTVQPGDTLYRISTTFFGHARGIDAILRANGLTEPNIRPGDVLYIPESY